MRARYLFLFFLAGSVLGASEIIERSGIEGGIVVHIGCGDGRLTSALRVDKRFVVQGLDTSGASVTKARVSIQSAGNYGPVSADRFDGVHLPYADNLVALLVVEKPFNVSKTEMMRALRPRGVLMMKSGGSWQKTVKPWPKNIDEWSHFAHGPDNNPVAQDTVSGPPRRMQWVAKPLWLRSHETPSSIHACVTAGCRIFYTQDDGPIGITDSRLPAKWSLVARDAFSGVELWRIPIPKYGWQTWSSSLKNKRDWTKLLGLRTKIPRDLKSLLVADSEHVYFTLGTGAPVSILDAATGKVVRTCAGTKSARSIRVSDGVLLVSADSLLAIDAKSGKQLWKRSKGNVAVADGRVYVSSTDVRCLDLKTGKEIWKVASKSKGADIRLGSGVLVLSGKSGLAALDAGTGKQLWSAKSKRGRHGGGMYIIGDKIWTGYQGQYRDLRTGKTNKLTVKNLWSGPHHHRCYPNKATSRYIIGGKEGMEYLDTIGKNHSQNNWVRGSCTYGIMPANGMVYAPADQCYCEAGVKQLGFNALAPAATTKRPDFGERFMKGPAFGKTFGRDVAHTDWPMYRHDHRRSGVSAASVSGIAKTVWSAKLGGKLSQPVAAGGKLYVSSIDTHTIHAMDAITGKPVWTFTAGGRIDSAPAIFNGGVYFGCADGWVYCVLAADGVLAWRFRAAPKVRHICAWGQIESAWPVHGSVLVKDGIVYCNAGRSTFLDGGIYLYGLDARTGKVLYQTVAEGPHGDIKKGSNQTYWYGGSRNDVLVTDGSDIYIKQLRFNSKLERVEIPVVTKLGDRKFGRHIFSTSGFLDDEWYNRTFWMNTSRWPGYYLANQASKSGQLLVADDAMTYGVRMFWTRNRHSPMFFPGAKGYLLFADDNDNEPGLVGAKNGWKAMNWLPKFNMMKGGKPGNAKNDNLAAAPQLSSVEAVTVNKDKGIGFTRGKPPKWSLWLPIRIRAMVRTANALFVAGPPDIMPKKDPLAALEGRAGGKLAMVDAKTGKKLSQVDLDHPPVFDGMIAAGKHLYIATRDGKIICMGE